MTPGQDRNPATAENPADSLADDMEDMDPGLARERTELAWTRTAISFAALGGTILKVNPAAGVVVLVVSGLIWEIGRLARRPAGPAGAPTGWQRLGQRRMLLLITIAVTAVSLVALVVALLAVGKSPLTFR
jgi:uncharacterized protein DUF202